MKIQTIDRAILRRIEADVQSALETVAERYGLSVKVGGGQFSPTTFKPKVEFATIGAGGVVESTEATAFRTLAKSYGFQPDDLGKTFEHGGRTFTICGLKHRAGKLPILAKSPDGRTYKFNDRDVLRLMGRQLPTVDQSGQVFINRHHVP